VKFGLDVFHAVGAEDVEGKGSEPREVGWFFPDAACIFVETDIANVMLAVFDAPVISDGFCCGLGGKVEMASVEGPLGRQII
jgi:hypothetical protein